MEIYTWKWNVRKIGLHVWMGARERERGGRGRGSKEFSKREPFALHIDEIDDDDTCTIAVHTKCV